MEKQIYRVSLFLLIPMLIAGVVLLCFGDKLPSIPCMSVVVFHLYCPGCGGTRAVKALLKGQILLSVIYHPVVLYSVVVYAVYLIRNTLYERTKRVKPMPFRLIYIWVALGIILGNAVVKNILWKCFDIPIEKIAEMFIK